MNLKFFISVLAVFANLLLAVGKILVGIFSNSVAIIAEGINSGTDVIASSLSFIGIKVAEKPADKGHPYGHEKAEVISGLLITIIILLSGLWIIYSAIKSFFIPSLVEIGILAFVVMGISAGVNGIMSQLKIFFGKKYDSVSLVSDGIHSRIDLLVSLGVFLGLFFVNYYSHADSILALLVGLYILKESFYLGKETTDSLLGASAGQGLENKIKEVCRKNNIEVESIKTQKFGNKVFAELLIKLPSRLKVEEAEKVRKNLQDKLLEEISELKYLSIQIQSHDVSTGYFKSALGLSRGVGWKKRFRSNKNKSKEGTGPGGYCVCPNSDCNYKIKHKLGVPCKEMKCPNHDINLIRENKK